MEMRSVILGFLIAVAWDVSAAPPIVISEFTGRVVGVIDGDTAKVLVGTKMITVRLEGIDAPEIGQSFGTRARQNLSSLVFGKTVTVRKTGEDRYGRTLGIIIEDGNDINAKMVEEGVAWHYKTYSNDERLAALESKARELKQNLWAGPNPIAPWDYRDLKRKPKEASTGTGKYWLNTSTNVRHNPTCENFDNTKEGRFCGKDEGKACGRCRG
jgi:micrococcal nuclease